MTPSSGVEDRILPRLDVERAEELMSFLLDPGVDLTGRLIGGCVETLCNLAGTP